MLSKRPFFLAFAVAIAALFAVNVFVAERAFRSIPRRVMQHTSDLRSSQVLAIGNSLMVAGFDESAFNSAAALPVMHGAVNLGLGASTPVEQLLLFRYALAKGMRPRLLLYGFYDFQLTEPVHLATPDFIGNRSMLYYLEPEFALRYYTLSWHDRAEFQAMRFFPMLVHRGAAWSRVEKFRRALAQQGMPAQAANQFGLASDFSLFEAASARDFDARCSSSASSPFAAPVEELFLEAHSSGMSIILVEMPMSPYHLRTFYAAAAWQPYLAHVRSLASRYGATFVDATTWIKEPSFFEDNLHLTPAGGRDFSRILGARIREQFDSQLGHASSRSDP